MFPASVLRNMSRLWNVIYRGFRYQVRAGAPFLEEENEQHRSVSSLQRTSPAAPVSCKEQFQSSNQKQHHNSNRFHKENEPYLFLELCGISSAFSIGWQYYQPDEHRKDQSCNNQSSLLRAIANIALAQPRVTPSKTKLSILPEKAKLSLTVEEIVPQQAQDSSTKEQQLDSTDNTKDEIQQTMVRLTKNIQKADDMLVAEWQNDAGVQLMSAAQSGGRCPQYDKVIKCKGDRTTIYLQEAFNCFKESRILGSAKGTFNLGLCYEQGLATDVDLEEAARCYAEAAAQGHAKAQYNLSLLHYQQKLASSNRIKAFKLMSSAARQGLQLAQSALQMMTLDTDASSLMNRNCSCDSLISSQVRSPSFRKIRSEPHRMCLDEVEEAEYSHIASVSFCGNGC